MTTTTEVTQADRDAAEEWRLDLDPSMRSLLAAHFARHRIAALAQGRLDGVKSGLEAAGNVSDDHAKRWGGAMAQP